ncbi:MAG: MoaD/ThiS family protein [Myxococcota bacterium]
MQVQLRLFANLREILPGDPLEHRGRTSLEVPADMNVQQLLDQLEIEPRMAQMLLVNGIQVARKKSDRTRVKLSAGDVVSIFPPLAGG